MTASSSCRLAPRRAREHHASVASAVVGVGVGRRRYRHVGWKIVGNIMLAWVTTLPATALLAVLFLAPWRWLA